MDAIAAHIVDNTGLATQAGDNAAILDHRHEVARLGFGADQVVIPADILLREGRQQAFGRLLVVVERVVAQRIADKALVELLAIGNEQ
ncbi:hypothetical protein D3C87_2061460 [compost metagenome]